jgi:hypothetical protein
MITNMSTTLTAATPNTNTFIELEWKIIFLASKDEQ